MDLAKLYEMLKNGELEKKLDNAEKTLLDWLEVVKGLKEAVAGFKTGGSSLGNILSMLTGKKDK